LPWRHLWSSRIHQRRTHRAFTNTPTNQQTDTAQISPISRIRLGTAREIRGWSYWPKIFNKFFEVIKTKFSEDRIYENLIKIQTPKAEKLGTFGHAQEHPTHQKSLRCIPLMVFYHHTQNYQKRSNGSQDIQIWKMEQSGWPRIFDVNNSITNVSQWQKKCCMI